MKKTKRSMSSAIKKDSVLSTYHVQNNSSIHFKMPDGSEVRLYVNEDGTYSSISVNLWDKEEYEYNEETCRYDVGNAIADHDHKHYKNKNGKVDLQIRKTIFTRKQEGK